MLSIQIIQMDNSQLTRITSTELQNKIKEAKDKGNLHLSNLNLCDCELKNINLNGFTLDNIIFSRHNAEDEDYKIIFNVSFEKAELNNVSFAHSNLKQCNFDNSKIKNGDFFYCKLMVCRFRSASVVLSDFRYSEIKNSSLSKCSFTECDFYMCGFLGVTTLHDTTLIDCSITDAIFEHNIIRIDNIKSLLQENYDTYINVLQHTTNRIHNPLNPKAHTVHNTDLTPEMKREKESQIASESADAYLSLSGIYQGKGYTQDSNKAYKRSNDWRLRHYILELRNKPFSKRTHVNILNILKYSGIQMMGYGYQWWKVCIIFLIVAIAGGAYMHFCVPDMDIMEAYARGLNNSMGPQESFAERVGNFLYSSTHSALGLLIIGFLGFILANKVRNNS